MYTNVDGLVLSLLELKDYLKNNKPDMVYLTEAILREEIKFRFAKERYSTQRRDRKRKEGKEGVIILVKENIVVEEVEFGDGMVETLSVVIKIKGSEKRKIIVTYIPPKTNAWETNKFKLMELTTKNSLEDMITKK